MITKEAMNEYEEAMFNFENVNKPNLDQGDIINLCKITADDLRVAHTINKDGFPYDEFSWADQVAEVWLEDYLSGHLENDLVRLYHFIRRNGSDYELGPWTKKALSNK